MRVLIIIMALTALTVLHSSHFKRPVVYLEASNEPFKVAPVERWTTKVPNAEHSDYCVLLDYKCPEAFHSYLLNLSEFRCEDYDCITVLTGG
jgi:hypothetical protein